MPERVQVEFFHDLLCPWCCLAAQRLDDLAQEFTALEVVTRPFPRFRGDAAAHARRLVAQARKAAKEPDGGWIRPDAFQGPDVPRSSLLPLAAAEAARAQGREAERRLLARLRLALWRDAVDVTRRDVVVELAASAGLELGAFLRLLDDPRTAHAVEEGRRRAERRGIRDVPSISFAGDYLVPGVHGPGDYRELLIHWARRNRAPALERLVH